MGATWRRLFKRPSSIRRPQRRRQSRFNLPRRGQYLLGFSFYGCWLYISYSMDPARGVHSYRTGPIRRSQGDGKADLIFQGWDNTFYSLSTGVGFTDPTPWIQHGGLFLEGQAHLVDLNGDGKADLIFQGWDNAFWVSLSTGVGFTDPTPWIQHGGLFLEGQAHLVDLNGDGKADLIFQGRDNTFWISLSTGAGFTAPAPEFSSARRRLGKARLIKRVGKVRV